ncbi:hypothetical protein [Gelidibacter pelagius]|uniref:Uncharacterized protein n=1 Tax=Gelidibacter pelagius TaxID=2819985 RepID=A0ABS3SQW4_9FLAO|nr:hypothetical protein [Gelidibacter pelagius]MBO3097846.1 hypothetical protein [Gelidibacter pelagius]
MFEGTDFLAIEGMSYSTVLALMIEVGYNGIKKFKTTKHFIGWLKYWFSKIFFCTEVKYLIKIQMCGWQNC